MPEASLKHLCETLKDHLEVTLVLRGLIEDSMEKTARKIDAIKGVFEINPELFEQYDIKEVPTFVLIKKDKPVARLRGNITLTYAKALFAEKRTYAS
jgi:type-F conjugative transfer system pilin assembly protein TrbC